MIDMLYQDLEIAKMRLKKNDLNLVLTKEGKVIFETRKPGIGGFLQAIDELNQNLVASSVADRIVGVAAAMLFAYSQVASVFALTISNGGVNVLESNSIKYHFEKKVANILNHNRTEVCPFERVAIASKNSSEAYIKLKALATDRKKKPPTYEC